MALRVPPLSADDEALEVQTFVNSLPSPCGVVFFVHSVLRSAAVSNHLLKHLDISLIC